MDSSPTTLHLFIDGVQQPVYITDIPNKVTFCV